MFLHRYFLEFGRGRKVDDENQRKKEILTRQREEDDYRDEYEDNLESSSDESDDNEDNNITRTLLMLGRQSVIAELLAGLRGGILDFLVFM